MPAQATAQAIPQSHFDRFLRPVLASRFVTISLCIHLLIIFIFGGRALFQKYVEPPDFQSSADAQVSTAGPQAPPPPPPAAALPPTATTPSTAAPPPLPAPSMSTLATLNPNANTFNVPMPTIDTPTISNQITAQPASFAQSNVTLPAAMSGRPGSGSGSGTGATYGERAPAEQAVVRALRWLQSQQQTDGTWSSGGFRGAFTGLALLCFLGHGETPQSHEFGGVVTSAINALVAGGNQHDGRLNFKDDFGGNDAVYTHAIATYALCEAYTMTKDPKIEPVVRKAVDYILSGQRPDGGWAYSYDLTPDTPKEKQYKSDTSVSGWQIQALKAAHLTGLSGMENIRNILNKAMSNMDRVFDEKDGTFGYRKPGDGHKYLTGVGVLSKLFWLGRPDREVRAGLKEIESNDLSYTAPECNLYAWYYNTQACFQAQGSAWDWWNSRFQDLLTSQQSADGSWPPTGGKETGGFNSPGGNGPVYRTTLCCLMLEVFYRYLPTTQDSALSNSETQGL